MSSPARTALALLTALAAGCSAQLGDDEPIDPGVDEDTDPGTDPEPPPPDPPPDPEPPPPVPEGARAVLEIHQMDVWAQLLPAGASLTVHDGAGARVEARGFPISRVTLDGRADYLVRLTAPDHDTLEVDVSYDGTDGLRAVSCQVRGAVRHGVSCGHQVRAPEPGAEPLPVHTVYLGLRHKWFSAAGRPARRGNAVDLLMDGEEAWSWVDYDLYFARDLIHISTWWWESSFELLRDWYDHADMTAAERYPYTMMGILEASPAVKRVLVGQFWRQDGLLDWVTADDAIRAKGAAAGDDFEFMGQANETYGRFTFAVEPFRFGERVRAAHVAARDQEFDAEPAIQSTVPGHLVDLTEWPLSVEVQHASWHQKFAVIDADIAYIGGMNVKAADWDSSSHLVYDHRRFPTDASSADRWDVIERTELPASGPRKDYMVRVQGPAAQDAAEVFKLRWDLARADGVEYADKASGFAIDRELAEVEGGVMAQVTSTMPDPLWEHSIAETWLNAVANAEEYIYIEDQYFRSPLLNDAIIERMQEIPDLKLIVITKPINEWVDPGCAWTYRGHAELEALFPDRYMLLQLRSFDYVETWGIDETEARFADHDVHSKMLIVDDYFLSVGSANKNNRGVIYEGELNLAVVDRAWVRAARQRILANMLPAGTVASEDVSVWWGQLEDAAGWNDMVRLNWEDEGDDLSLDGAPLPTMYTPRGFVYGMDFRSVDYCLLEDVGEDMV